MTQWWPCAAGMQLLAQINERWPHRDKSSDGSIGDTAHATRHSDHNPDPSSQPPGVVRARDVDRDLDPARPEAMRDLVAALLRIAPVEGRLSYIIFDGQIASRVRGWTRRPYTGVNAHKHHAHISFTELGDHDGRPFDLQL